MVTLILKHSLITRLSHWLNFILLVIMIWSGLMIYWSHPVYFIPKEWLTSLGLGRLLAEGMAWHFSFAVVFVLNGLAYILYLLISNKWKKFITQYGILQRSIYTLFLLNGIWITLTGFAIYKPIQLDFLVTLCGGYESARYQHFISTIIFLVFSTIHIIQVCVSGWKNFAAMVTGVRIKDEK